jgi:hypothetical protein
MKKTLYRIKGYFYKGASARGYSPPTRSLIMFKIQIRSNGNMVDYSDQRFSTRKDAQKVLCRDCVNKSIWADMRVVAA